MDRIPLEMGDRQGEQAWVNLYKTKIIEHKSDLPLRQSCSAYQHMRLHQIRKPVKSTPKGANLRTNQGTNNKQCYEERNSYITLSTFDNFFQVLEYDWKVKQFRQVAKIRSEYPIADAVLQWEFSQDGLTNMNQQSWEAMKEITLNGSECKSKVKGSTDAYKFSQTNLQAQLYCYLANIYGSAYKLSLTGLLYQPEKAYPQRYYFNQQLLEVIDNDEKIPLEMPILLYQRYSCVYLLNMKGDLTILDKNFNLMEKCWLGCSVLAASVGNYGNDKELVGPFIAFSNGRPPIVMADCEKGEDFKRVYNQSLNYQVKNQQSCQGITMMTYDAATNTVVCSNQKHQICLFSLIYVDPNQEDMDEDENGENFNDSGHINVNRSRDDSTGKGMTESAPFVVAQLTFKMLTSLETHILTIHANESYLSIHHSTIMLLLDLSSRKYVARKIKHDKLRWTLVIGVQGEGPEQAVVTALSKGYNKQEPAMTKLGKPNLHVYTIKLAQQNTQ